MITTLRKTYQSEFFFQFYRSLTLSFIEWDWSNTKENIPRITYTKVLKTLYPNGTGELSLPHLADFVLIPDSDWYITQDFVEIGEKWKNAYEELLFTLNGLGIFVPNITETTNLTGKAILLTFKIKTILVKTLRRKP